MNTLVVCLYRGDPLPGSEPPVIGRSAVERLVTAAGVGDPEDSRVNCLLEGIRVARDLEDATVAVLAGTEGTVSSDRAIAEQIDRLSDTHDPTSAVVVVDSAEDERLVPIVESRVPVDAVDRVVVRQARDIESTYYQLKQFLADEQLRKSVLVPIGIALLAFPALLTLFDSITVSVSAIATVTGVFLLYKGLSVDRLLATLATEIRQGLYSGQVSLVTYVVAGGLSLVGLAAGGFAASSLQGDPAQLLVAVQFVHDAIPWLTGAALIASTGRLLDEFIRDDDLASAYLNLPFAAIAVGVAVRGFVSYLLTLSDERAPLTVPRVVYGPVEIDSFAVSGGTHLAVFILASIVISLIGVQVASYMSSAEYDVGPDERRT
ncbi:MAG: putative membrane protein [halophilic archaeon J07HX5]|nr:MAG: putative membrane protein [halophilic archaeon J07HX5]